MTLYELAKALDLRELAPGPAGETDINQGYTSDLLSDILAHAPAGGVLVTIQSNPDLVAVASLAGLRAVIFSGGRTPGEDLVRRAATEGLALFESQAESFDIVGKLYESGLRGGCRPATSPPSQRGHRGKRRAEAGWRRALPLPVREEG